MNNCDHVRGAPLISIVIPTYNHAKYLKVALKSIIEQNYKNWEVIIVNNNSTDNTLAIISEFNDSRFCVINIENHGIIAVSKNKGIEVARAEWIAFLDSDDSWTPDKLEVVVEKINGDESLDLIYHELKILKENSNKLRRKKLKTWQLPKSTLKSLLLRGNPIANSSVVVRKYAMEQIGCFPISPSLIASEDYFSWLKLAALNKKFLLIKKPMGNYLIHENNVSNNINTDSLIAAVENFRGFLNARENKKLDALINYVSGKKIYEKRLFKDAIMIFVKNLYKADLRIKIKSLVFIFFIIFKL